MNAEQPIQLESLESVSPSAEREIKSRCALMNFAVYETGGSDRAATDITNALGSLAKLLGQSTCEDHRSMGENGIVTLSTSNEGTKRGYIPYTSRPLNWHTDGYYNDPKSPVLAFLLHCHMPASEGGVNQLIDPEIVYMRMRDEHPAFVDAFFHPEAMTIPANVETDGSERPPSTGPVFFVDAKTGRLQMRYTARTRSIEWRNDPATQDASDWMRDWLAREKDYVFTHRLKAGQGIISNNVLHNRTGFVDDPNSNNQRVMMRMRFHDRISEDKYGPA